MKPYLNHPSLNHLGVMCRTPTFASPTGPLRARCGFGRNRSALAKLHEAEALMALTVKRLHSKLSQTELASHLY
jgi:hypothetical protein